MPLSTGLGKYCPPDDIDTLPTNIDSQEKRTIKSQFTKLGHDIAVWVVSDGDRTFTPDHVSTQPTVARQ